VKRPCNAYMMFIKHFMSANSASYDGVRNAVSAGKDLCTILQLTSTLAAFIVILL